jgi:PD-(D/E)XK nuclease family transposase
MRIVAIPHAGAAVQFINPITDFAFKKIFGSAESHDILLSFLNAVLGFEAPYRIKEVRIEDPYLAPPILGMKDSFVDVRATDEQGRHLISPACWHRKKPSNTLLPSPTVRK